MLKQESLFKKLRRKKLTLAQYNLLYIISSKDSSKFNEKQRGLLHSKLPKLYLNPNASLSEEGYKLLKSIDNLFKPQKSLKAIDLLGEDYEKKIVEFVELFPTGKLPSNKYARGNKKNIEENLKWFFQEYDEYDWDLILDATDFYVTEYAKKNYKYMRTCQYFIKKLKDGTVESELATYCEVILNGEDVEKETFKKNVV